MGSSVRVWSGRSPSTPSRPLATRIGQRLLEGLPINPVFANVVCAVHGQGCLERRTRGGALLLSHAPHHSQSSAGARCARVKGRRPPIIRGPAAEQPENYFLTGRHLWSDVRWAYSHQGHLAHCSLLTGVWRCGGAAQPWSAGTGGLEPGLSLCRGQSADNRRQVTTI